MEDLYEINEEQIIKLLSEEEQLDEKGLGADRSPRSWILRRAHSRGSWLHVDRRMGSRRSMNQSLSASRRRMNGSAMKNSCRWRGKSGSALSPSNIMAPQIFLASWLLTTGWELIISSSTVLEATRFATLLCSKIPFTASGLYWMEPFCG